MTEKEKDSLSKREGLGRGSKRRLELRGGADSNVVPKREAV